MRWSTRTVLTALCLLGASGISVAQVATPAATPSADAADKPAADQAPATFDTLVGQKLTAIDGSSISLSPAEGGIAREIVSSTGAIQRTYFAFISDRLGTVADASDIRKVTGVFRRVPMGIEIEYADGSTERLGLNPGGGLTLETTGAPSDMCMSWYPQGHSFSIEERKAALAAFAVKLGLADAPKTGKTDCGKSVAADVKPIAVPATSADARMAIDAVKPMPESEKRLQTGKGAPAVPPIPARPPRGVVVASGKAPAVTTPPTTAALAAETQSVEVRKSEIHVIDPPPAPAADAKPQVLASATPPPNPAAPEVRGASTCLSVESDGMHWGFRNHCGYDVQFAYCLMSGNPLAACHEGAVAGSVSANGFGALVADESLKETDAKHDFRWVACQGGAGEVIPHLDQIEPPSGRCVR